MLASADVAEDSGDGCNDHGAGSDPGACHHDCGEREEPEARPVSRVHARIGRSLRGEHVVEVSQGTGAEHESNMHDDESDEVDHQWEVQGACPLDWEFLAEL